MAGPSSGSLPEEKATGSPVFRDVTQCRLQLRAQSSRPVFVNATEPDPLGMLTTDHSDQQQIQPESRNQDVRGAIAWVCHQEPPLIAELYVIATR